MPPPLLHQRLLNEATLLGTEGLLQQLPVEYSQALEQAIHQQVRQAVLHYASGLDTLARQLDPFCGESAHMHHPLAKRKRLGYTGRLTIKEEETMTTRNAAQEAQQAEPATQERQAGDDSPAEAAQKKWTPPADPFGFENKLAGKNRVQLLKSEGEKAWVIRFAENPNQGEYSKENPHPVLKMLKDEGFRWGFDGGDGKGGWGKKWSNDPYGTDHLKAREVLDKATEMLGGAKEPERTPF